VAAHRAGEHHFACRAGITHPVGFAAGADQVAPSLKIERVHWLRDYLVTLSPSDFENVEMAADQANPNERSEDTTQDPLDGGRPEIAWSIPGHQSIPPAIGYGLFHHGIQASLSPRGLGGV
jgi:hypothetical protein